MKRIGCILASIHAGSAVNLWTSLIREASRSGLPIYLFPGGRLDSRPDSEYLRNSIYSLVNTDNLDGLICWGSSLGGAVPVTELNNFHSNLASLPYITIAHKMENHACVRFDAYTGMKALVKHFIETHGAKKIAFLRGPYTHESAKDRFRGYRDALIESNIPFEETSPLVSDPFPWNAGESAILQLCNDRKLVPGKDFDTLICSSDMMAFNAVRYLSNLGFTVPRDYCVGGFNDSPESRMLSCSFSTVRMPYSELGTEAFSMIRQLVDGSSIIEDRELTAEVVIRDSCGCSNISKDAKDIIEGCSLGEESAKLRLITILGNLFRLDKTEQIAVIKPVVEALLSGNSELFFSLFERVLGRFFEGDIDPALVLDAIDILRNSGCLTKKVQSLLSNSASYPTFHDFEKKIYQLITLVQGRVFSLKRYEIGKRNAVLNSLKCDLLCARDRTTLLPILSRHLTEIGMTSVAVVTLETETLSRCLGFFAPGIKNFVPSERFSSRLLLPLYMSSYFSSGVIMIQPLFMENQPLGYLVHSVPFADGAMFEELRSAISSALKGIYLFEESSAARKVAEQAERAKSEFFANVGTDLSDPLGEIFEKLELIEQRLGNLSNVDPLSLQQLSAIKGQVSSQLEKTNRLIDLTLSHINELVMEKSLFSITSIYPQAGTHYPQAGTHPLICADQKRIAQACMLLSQEFQAEPLIRSTLNGLQLIFSCDRIKDDSVWTKNDILLAERIILIHCGDFIKQQTGCEILLPWPTLCGLPPLKKNDESSHFILLPGTRNVPVEEFNIPSIQYDSETSESSILVWNSDTARAEDWEAVFAIRHQSSLFRLPFLCYGSLLRGATVVSAIELLARERKAEPMLFIGTSFERFPLWASAENSVCISSLDDFTSFAATTTPSLIVFSTVDMQSLIGVRQHPSTVLVPILVIPEKIEAEEDVALLCAHPRIILCNSGIAASPDFAVRIKSIISGSDMLPPHTGALVKKAILYINIHAATQIARWKLADSVHVSEDYLTRIFHKEIGLSLWEYLNRYRIFLACEFLLHTNDTIYEIALRTGFQDQAYFCRVFKKIHGIPPGKLRTRKSE